MCITLMPLSFLSLFNIKWITTLVDYIMVDRIRCASIVLISLSIAFCLSGSLLITFSDSLVSSAVKKVLSLFIFLLFSQFLFLERNVN